MADTTEHLLIPKPNRARVPSRNIDEQFDELALAMDMVDAFIHALRQAVDLLAPADHEQAMETITGLVDALNAKMPADRQFKLDDLTDVDGATAAPVNYVLVKSSGGLFVPSTALAALGVHPHLISEVTGLAAALTDRPTRDEVAAGLDVLNDDLMAEIQKRGVSLGIIVYSAVPLEDQGYLKCNGAPCTPVFPDLRTALLAAGSPFGHNGTDPLLPDEVTANRFRRAAGGALALGTVQADQMQGHWHEFWSSKNSTAGSTTAGYLSDTGNQAINVNNTARDAISDGVNGTPRVGSETRPKSISYLPYIKAFGAITIEGMADLSALFNALATEMEAVAGTDNTKLMTALRVRQAMKLRNSGLITLSGTSFEMGGIPAGVQRVVLDLSVAASVAAALELTIGDDSGILTSGYSGTRSAVGASTVGSANLLSTAITWTSSTSQHPGLFVFTRQSGNLWKVSGNCSYSAPGINFINAVCSGLTGSLSRIKLSTGSAATLSGTAKLWWEF